MNIKKLTTVTAAVSASLLLCGPRLSAQDSTAATPAPAPAPAASAAPATTNPGGGGNGGQDWRQRMTDMINQRVKTELKATDDEWAVIQPLLQKVFDAQMAERTMTARGMFGGGRRGGGGGNAGGGNGGGPGAGGNGGGGPGGGNGPQGSPESTALSTALQSDSTSNDDIKAKLTALRAARKQAEADLDAARANLQKVLTLRQEAVLVNMGILE